MESFVLVEMPTDEAELVILNGKIWTPTSSNATALATRNGRIMSIGTDEQIKALMGPSTKILNARRRRVVPGFIDVHTHLDKIVDFETLQLDIQIPPCKDLDEGLRKIEEECLRIGPGQWIVAVAGVGRPMPTKAELDSVSPLNPVAIMESIHVQYLNSKALELSGITRTTKPPTGGTINRDEDGEPTGRIQECANMWYNLVPLQPYEQRKQCVLDVLKKFASYGVTTVGDFPQPRSMKIYQDLKDEGRLPIRLRLNFFTSGGGADRPSEDHSTTDLIFPVSDTYDNFLSGFGPRTGFGDDWIKFGALKLFLDGDGESAVHYDDSVKRDSWSGERKLSQEELNAMVGKAHRNGWQMLIHAVGDKAQDMCLDAYEYVQKKWPRPNTRHRIEHMGLNEAGPTTREMLERAKKLNVLPLVTGAWIYLGDGEGLHLTDDPQYIYRTLLDHGFRIPGNSDSDGSMPESWQPLFTIWAQVTRQAYDGSLNRIEQAITVSEALKGWTEDSAWAEFSEFDKGTLEVGKLADIIILDEDPLTCDKVKLKDIQVVNTIVGGNLVYERN